MKSKRVIALIIVVIMVIPYVNVGAVPLLEGSAKFLAMTSDKISRIQELSLTLMALGSVEDKTEFDVKPVLDGLTQKLLQEQNPDGGWGYYPNSPSNVVDTAYALVALAKIKGRYMTQQDIYSEILDAIEKGQNFLLDSRSKVGWGYVPDTKEECYPTIMAVWALGELGYTWYNPVIENSTGYLNSNCVSSCELPENEAFGLKLIAYKSIGYPVDNKTIQKLKEKLFNETLTTRVRAILTYALTMYESFDFDVAKALLLLENEKKGTGPFFWNTQTWMFSSPDTVTTSAYALMALSVTASFLKPEERPQTPYSKLCIYLKVIQNSDGGWGYPTLHNSDPKSTYYAIKGLQACYFKTPDIIKGLNWTKRVFSAETSRLRELHTVTASYYYLIKTLVEFNALTDDEIKDAIDAVKSVKLTSGLWGSEVIGPQPLDTAFAVATLLELGVPANDSDIQRAKSWLLSLSKSGWGVYISGYFYSYMTTPDVVTTMEVLNALYPISSREELMPYIKWIISQRNPDGSWSYRKGSDNMKVETTVRITNLLQKFGYDFTSDTTNLLLNWTLENKLELDNPVDIGLAVTYLIKLKFIPHVSLYDLIIALSKENFKIIAPNGDNTTVKTVVHAIHEFFGMNVTISNETLPEKGNYIALGSFNTFNIDNYNPYISYRFNGSYISIESRKYSTEHTVVIIPGVTEEGHVLFVLYNGALGANAVRTLFESGFVKYLHDEYLIIKYTDKNGDGKIELTEMEAILVR
ncbi:prenyltransferase/squalene oxidase repeat-containing protein [Thermococcus sp.]